MKVPLRSVDFSGPNDSFPEKESDGKCVEKRDAAENSSNEVRATSIDCENEKKYEKENRPNVEGRKDVIEIDVETLGVDDSCPRIEAANIACGGYDCCRNENVKVTGGDDFRQNKEFAVENGVNSARECCQNVGGTNVVGNDEIRRGNNCCQNVEGTNIVRSRKIADDSRNIESTVVNKGYGDESIDETSDYCRHIEGTTIFDENCAENMRGAEEPFPDTNICGEKDVTLPSSVGLYCNSVDDIEDIVNSTDHVFEGNRRADETAGRVRARIIQKPKSEILENDWTPSNMRSVIPGTHSVYVKTWGCTHNTSDSEYMAGQLRAYGYEITPDKNRANLWLLNSCTVKNPAEDHFRNEIESARKLDKYVVVAGCVPQGAPRLDYIRGLSVIGVQQIDRVVYVVEETLKGHSVRLMGKKKIAGKKGGGSSLALPKVRKNPLVEIIPISTGCLNACTYCKTKHARGELGSYPVDEIASRATQAFGEGVKELWLTSEDTGAYGIDIGTDLPTLLRSVIEKIPAGCMLRLGMTNPPYIMRHVDAICEILNHPRVYKFLHIPVQSASNRVLDTMKREYTVEQFRQLVDTLRDKVPRITIATDIICGFPTETEDDFQETVDLCDTYKFPALYVNQFYARRGTPAARMAREASAVDVKKRTRRLCDLFHSYRTNEYLLGEVVDTLFTEVSADGSSFVGHSPWYQQVVVPKMDRDADLLGKVCKVEILEVKKYCVIGKVKKYRVVGEVLKFIPLLKNEYFRASFELFLLVVVVTTLVRLFFGQN